MKFHRPLPTFATRPPADVLPDILAWREFTGDRPELPQRKAHARIIAYGFEAVPGAPTCLQDAFRLGRILRTGVLELEGESEFTPFLWALLHSPESGEAGN
jgi:hypothetical protein